jgi:hypothetical protein
MNGRQGHVTIKALEIYPSAGRLVVGIQITADVPGRWFDVNGWFYLLAMPKIDADRRVVHFEHLELARQTDNFLVNAATALTVIEPVRQLIEPKVELPYGAKYDDLVEKMQQRLNAKISDDVQTRGLLDYLVPGTISLTNTGLVVPVLAQGSLEVDVAL